MKTIYLHVKDVVMQKDSADDLKTLLEWFEKNRIRETGIITEIEKQEKTPEQEELLGICSSNIEEYSMLIQLIASIIEREKE